MSANDSPGRPAPSYRRGGKTSVCPRTDSEPDHQISLCGTAGWTSAVRQLDEIRPLIAINVDPGRDGADVTPRKRRQGMRGGRPLAKSHVRSRQALVRGDSPTDRGRRNWHGICKTSVWRGGSAVQTAVVQKAR